MRADPLSPLHPHGSSDEHRGWCGRRRVGGRAERLASGLLPGGWVSGVPAFCPYAELEGSPSPQLFLFSLLYFSQDTGEGLPLSLMTIISSTRHPTLRLGT